MKKIKHRKLGQLNILGRIVPVYETKVMPQGYEDCLGLYFEFDRKILLNSNMPKSHKIEILYHEIYHALMDRLGFNQTDLSNNTHELLCEAFRNITTDLFNLKDKKLLDKL